MKVPLITKPSRETASARRFALIILGAVVLLVVPLYVRRQFIHLRTEARHPVSSIFPAGEPFSPRRLIHRLNPHGKKILMRDVLAARTADQFGASAAPFPPGQKTAVTFDINGTERHAVVYVPTSYSDNVANTSVQVAMMVLYHGLNDNCEHFLDATGFVPHAEQEGFLIVSACGSQGYLGTAWNAGMCCGFSADTPDDILFARTIVQEMRQAVHVDGERVMAVGFSNGAMLAELLACRATSEYRAVVSIGGVVEERPGNSEGLAKCTAESGATVSRSSVLMVHGTSDIMVPWGGNGMLGFPSIEANLAGWVERNGCPPASADRTIDGNVYSNTVYSSCSSHSAMNAQVGRDDNLVILAPELKEKVLINDGILAPELEEKTLEADDTVVPEDAAGAFPSARAEVEVLAAHNMGRAGKAIGRLFRHDYRHGHHGWVEKRHHNDDGDADDDGDDGDKGNDNVDGDAAVVAAVENDHHKHNHHHREDKQTREGKEPHHRGHRHHGPHGPHHPHRHHPHHRGGKHPHPPLPLTTSPVVDGLLPLAPQERPPVIPRGDGNSSQIELVRVEGGGHRWPEDDMFSTTDYIVEFGARVFGRYN